LDLPILGKNEMHQQQRRSYHEKQSYFLHFNGLFQFFNVQIAL
jgi:hypothetical protein